MPPETWLLVLQESKTMDGAFGRIGVGVYEYDGDRRQRSRKSESGCPLFDSCESATIKIV